MDNLNAKSVLLDEIGTRSVVIWGARMTGIGFARFAKANAINVLGFIDSDTALKDKHVSGLLVRGVDYLVDLRNSGEDFVVVLAVSLKEDEIKATCAQYGLSDADLILYSKYCRIFYTIDVVGTCNLKCSSCVHGIPENSLPKGIMSLSTFKDVVDKIKNESPLLTHVCLYNWGEPFLHPELSKIVDHLHGNDIAVALSTNLSIRFEDRIDSVIKSSPDYLKISLSGYYAKAYDKTHAGGDINLVKSNLYRLRYLIDRYHSATFVDVNYHLYRDNNGRNLSKMRELCDELGFALSTVHALVMPLERALAFCDGKPDLDTLLLSQNLLVGIDEGIEAASAHKGNGCPFMDNQVNINFDLTVPVCCTVADRKNTIVESNFLLSTPESIKNNKRKVDLCAKCMAYGLPEYNMGYNRSAWDQIASGKSSLDR